ncbi:MAG: hypothetical protein AAF211_09995 [Myxococcota bacterium]
MNEQEKKSPAPKKVAKLKVKTGVRGGPNRRAHDHIGNFNFKVEIEGVTQG